MPNEYVYTPPALMSLSNPDTVVTEERLYQFYQQILPYLGGMPDILANKFSKADLYSTDEKLIGRWIDGKPLYQLTFKVTNISSSSRIYKDILDATNLNIEHLIFGYGWYSGSGDVENTLYRIIPSGDTGTGFAICYRKNTKKIQAVLNGSVESPSDCYGYVTIQYTKTTDSAVEIGDDTDYSTTEKIVGTWIDGKLIWQKTFYTTSSTAGSEVDISYDANIDTVVNLEGLFHRTDNSTSRWLPINCYTQSNMYGFLCYDMSGKNIKYKLTGYSTDKQIITIQYTKTSS